MTNVECNTFFSLRMYDCVELPREAPGVQSVRDAASSISMMGDSAALAAALLKWRIGSQGAPGRLLCHIISYYFMSITDVDHDQS